MYVSVEGAAKEKVSCDFSTHSFDLKVLDCAGENYRLRKDNLDKAIVPAESKARRRLRRRRRRRRGWSWIALTDRKGGGEWVRTPPRIAPPLP